MAYTRIWDEASPTDDDDAVDIDDYIRNRMVDIRERMADILGADGDWATDDPVIPSTHTLSALFAGVGATGSQANVERTIGWYAGHIIVEVGTVVHDAAYLAISGASGEAHIIVPVILPVGVTITQVRARVFYNDSDHTIDGTFFGRTDGNLNYNQALSAPSPVVTPQWMTASSLTHTTIADQHYGFSIRADNNNLDTSTELRIYAVQVKYTHPGGVIR